MFRLISDHHIQRGPSFPKTMDVLIDASTGQIREEGPLYEGGPVWRIEQISPEFQH